MASMAAEFALLSSGLDMKKRVCNIPISSPLKVGYNKQRFNCLMTKALLQEELKGLKQQEGLVFDVVKEMELREKGFLGMRKTKLVCTVGPACCSYEELEKLALGGMNVARLNMCHNIIDWHQDVIRKIKKLNQEKGFCVSVMIDTEGSQIHVLDHGAPSSVKAEEGSIWLFTTEKFNGCRPFTVQANYEGFNKGVKEGDELVVDGGMTTFEVVERVGNYLRCMCTDPG